MSVSDDYEVAPRARVLVVVVVMASLCLGCVEAVMRRLHLGYFILIVMELAFASCVYEILFVGWAVERHCTIEGDGVSIEMAVVERGGSSSSSSMVSDRLQVLMNATFRIDNDLLEWHNHPVKLRRIRDLLVGHYDTERERPIDIKITWDMGLSDDHVLRDTMKGSAYQICYEQGNGINFSTFWTSSSSSTPSSSPSYTFDHPGNPDHSVLSLGIVISLVNIVLVVWWCAAARRRQ